MQKKILHKQGALAPNQRALRSAPRPLGSPKSLYSETQAIAAPLVPRSMGPLPASFAASSISQ